jgi:uncharacterized protein YlxP (DUF503 family)
MVIGVLQFELVIDAAQSLKDKRRVVRSLKDRLHRDHLVSVAEVGSLEVWNLASMGLALVSRDAAYVNSVLDRILEKLRALPDARLRDYAREVLDPDQVPGAEHAEDGSPLWTEDERRADADATLPHTPATEGHAP